jgi:hypothetical protein
MGKRVTLGLLLAAAGLAPMVACGGNASPGDGAGAYHPSGSGTTAPTTHATADGGADAPTSVGGLPRWANGLGGPNADSGSGIVTDLQGNSLIVGTFQDTAVLGGVPMTSAGQIDFFVAKYSPTGTPLWVRPFGGPGNDAATGVAVASNGDVYVVGASDGALFGGGAGDAGAGAGTFLLQLDTFGNAQVAEAFGGDSYGTTVGIAIAADGTIAMCGAYRAGLDLGGGPLAAPGGSVGAFVATFAPPGASADADAEAGSPAGGPPTLIAATPLGGTGTSVANAVAFGLEDTVVVIGTFDGSGDFGGGMVTSAGATDVFASAFTAAGTPVWSKHWGGTGEDDGRAVAADAAGDTFFAGGFSATVMFGASTATSNGSTDAFVVKLDPSGSVTWDRTYGGAGGDEATSVAVDSGTDVLLGGLFEGTMTVGVTPFVSAGDQDIFVIKLGPSASNVWSKHFGGVEADQGLGVAFDTYGRAFGTGYFRTSVDFGTGPQVSAGDDDIFVASFDP